ncbi:MAG: hypothetical protein P1U83_01795 [Roseovarius sp.]|nr:hypothetical protein [Roseovarius sp.]
MMPTRSAKLSIEIVNRLENTDLESPSAVREAMNGASPIVVQILSELAARQMLKPATRWPGQPDRS